ncbi:hypothetical protein EJV46_03460 [Roseococcus sp. SYP-B2431]|uniref:hypothetical protein n=1 Tax=Roseococcus sp. SYP-B2431 TaxID=2496640 RepID=UPI00103BD626|nr:hypothetical protein [Roseococcus sp. SYP-B2431]TCH99742.1 hypothetical protein EJV46_03460 [Roseococcus sp. SYP-B2431]
MLKRLSLLPLLALATACATVPGATVDPAARRAMMQALPDQASCRPTEPEGARACTMRLGTKEVRVSQYQNLTTIRYDAADTADPAFVAGMRRVLTTANTPNLDRAMTLITSHGRSGAMENFTTGCFPDESTPPVNRCFVMLTY